MGEINILEREAALFDFVDQRRAIGPGVESGGESRLGVPDEVGIDRDLAAVRCVGLEKAGLGHGDDRLIFALGDGDERLRPEFERPGQFVHLGERHVAHLLDGAEPGDVDPGA